MSEAKRVRSRVLAALEDVCLRRGPAQRLALSFAAAALSACTGSLLDTDLPVNALYVLAPAPPSEAGNATPVDLAISLPDVAPGLDTNRIAVLTGRQLDYYRAARWGGLTSEVVQTFLVDSFEDQHLFRSVTSDQTRVAGDYILDVALRDFQAEYSGSERAPSVHVKMIGRLIRVVDRELVATIDAEARASAGDNRMRAVAAAFERAAQQVVVELARETAVAVAGDASTLSSARDERNLAASP